MPKKRSEKDIKGAGKNDGRIHPHSRKVTQLRRVQLRKEKLSSNKASRATLIHPLGTLFSLPLIVSR